MPPDDDLAFRRRAFDTAARTGVLGPDMPQQVLIADDHPLMRSALAPGGRPGLPRHRGARGRPLRPSCRPLLADAAPELVLLDLHMPGMSGFIGLMMLRSEHPEIPVIVVSAAEDAGTVQRSIDYGASGFVPKSAPLGQVAEAIRAVLDGEIWLPATAGGPDDADAAMAERAVNLTPQQLRVLLGMAEGKLNKQIAWDMAISEQTVKDHVTVILRKLGASQPHPGDPRRQPAGAEAAARRPSRRRPLPRRRRRGQFVQRPQRRQQQIGAGKVLLRVNRAGVTTVKSPAAFAARSPLRESSTATQLARAGARRAPAGRRPAPASSPAPRHPRRRRRRPPPPTPHAARTSASTLAGVVVVATATAMPRARASPINAATPGRSSMPPATRAA